MLWVSHRCPHLSLQELRDHADPNIAGGPRHGRISDLSLQTNQRWNSAWVGCPTQHTMKNLEFGSIQLSKFGLSDSRDLSKAARVPLVEDVEVVLTKLRVLCMIQTPFSNFRLSTFWNSTWGVHLVLWNSSQR